MLFKGYAFLKNVTKMHSLLKNHIIIGMEEFVLLVSGEEKIKSMIKYLLGDKVSENDTLHALKEIHKQGFITDNELREVMQQMEPKKGLASC